MFPCGFDESNGALSRPPGEAFEDCEALEVLHGIDDQKRLVVVSCWKVTKEELEEINRTGRVWLMLWGSQIPPANVSGVKPF